VVSRYLAVWELRSRYRENPPKDEELAGFSEQPLTKDEQEILESNWLRYARGSVMPRRQVAGLLAVKFVDQHMWRYKGIRWGSLARVRSPASFVPTGRRARLSFRSIESMPSLRGGAI
jgi:hypothetical protein